MAIIHHDVYTIARNVRCVKCGNKGAVKYKGRYYPHGMGDELDNIKSDIVKETYEKYRNSCYVSPAMGFGGTIPHTCLNCGNTGLIDLHGMECYVKAFESIKEESTDG